MKNAVVDKTYYLKGNPRLFDETLSEFADKDYESASLNEILKRSGFNKGSFYYRFDDKVDLYSALVGALHALHAELLHESWKTVRDFTGIKNGLTILIASLIQLGVSDQRYLALYSHIASEPNRFIEPIFETVGPSPIDKFIVESRVVLSEAEAIDQENAEIFAVVTRNVLYHFLHIAKKGDGWLEPASFADALLRLAVVGRTEASNDLFAVRNVTFSYGNETAAVDQADFRVARGEIVAVFGGAGAGKSTLLKLVEGKLKPSSGDVAYFSPDLTKRSGRDLTVIPSGLRFNLSVRQNLKRSGTVSGSDDESTLLEELGMTEIADVKLKRLPDAVKIKTDFACADVRRDGLILIDDALQGLGDQDKERICRLLLKWKHNGNTILLTTSRMDEALRLADTVLFMRQGAIVKSLSAAELMRKYGNRTVVVDYYDGGVARRKTIELKDLAGSEFRDLAASNRIIEIQSSVIAGAEVYKIETGALLR